MFVRFLATVWLLVVLPGVILGDEQNQKQQEQSKQSNRERDIKEDAEEPYSGPELRPLSGTITLNGRPLANANISMANRQFVCGARSDEMGNWTMVTGVGPRAYSGVPMGTFRPTVHKREKIVVPGMSEPGDDAGEAEIRVYAAAVEEIYRRFGPPDGMLPAKYANPATSGLVIEVGKSGNTECELSLVNENLEYDDSELGPLQITHGTIILDGEPLSGAEIRLKNERCAGKAISDANGRWKMLTIQGESKFPGVPIGNYSMTILHLGTVDFGIPKLDNDATARNRETYWTAIEKLMKENGGLQEVVPEQYANSETSGLKLVVDMGATTDYRIELQSDE